MKLSDDVAIFWDYENCPVPNNSSGYVVANSITSMARPFGRVRLFRAYLEIAEQLSLRSELQSSGVSLVDCPHNGRKDVADKMILVDMLTYAIDNPTPCTIIVITGDRDFAYALSMLKIRHFQMVLVTLPNAHVSLTSQASLRYDWMSTTRNTTMGPTWEHFRSTSTAQIDDQYNQRQTTQEVVTPSQYTTHSSTKSYTRPINSTNLVESDETPNITHLLRQHSQRCLSDSGLAVGRPVSGQRNPLPFANVTASQDVKHVYKYEHDQQPTFETSSVAARSLNGQTSVGTDKSVTTPPVAIELSRSGTLTQQTMSMLQDEIAISAPLVVPNRDAYAAPKREMLPDSEETPSSDDEIEPTSRSRFVEGAWVADCSEDDSESLTRLSTVDSIPAHAESGSNTPVLQTPFNLSTELNEDEMLDSEVTLGIVRDDNVDIKLLPDNVGQTPTVRQLLSSPQPLGNLSDIATLGLLASPLTQAPSSDGIKEVNEESIASKTSTTNSHVAVPDSQEIPLDFDLLETILEQLKGGGILRPLRSTVAVLLSANGTKYENVALEEVDRYIEWALAEELILTGGEGDKAWISLRQEIDEVEQFSGGNIAAVPPATNTEHQASAIWSNPSVVPFEMLSSNSVEPLPSMLPRATMLGIPPVSPFVSQRWPTTTSQGLGTAITSSVGGTLLLSPSTFGLASRTVISQPQPSLKPTLKKVEVKVVHTRTNNDSTSSLKQSTSATQRHIPSHFVILVQSLQANRNSGERRTLRTDLALQIANDGRTYERAGVSKLRSYLHLAVQEGIVEIGGNDGDAWVRLRPEWYNAIPAPTASKKKIIPSEFVELVQALQNLRQEGSYKPVRSLVASQLSRGVYKKAGVPKWTQYADLAVSEGIVKLGISDGQDWISLHPKWHHAVVS